MDTDDRDSALRHELRDVEDELSELRDAVSNLRRQIGERWFEPMDASERAALLTAAEEQEALAESLEARRDEIRRLLETNTR
jgi:hypothetical protein